MANQIENQAENEIDLIEVFGKLWDRRKFILKITVGFMVFGVLVALFSSKEYTAGCTIVPQTGEKASTSGLGGLAAIAGINLGNMSTSDVLSPKIYPKVLASVPFQKELMRTPVKFERIESPVTLMDYYTYERYKKFSFAGMVLKYTIGLPGVIIRAIRGERPDPVVETGDSKIQTLSKEEYECSKILKGNVSVVLNEKEGYVTIAAVMPEPLAAAQVAAQVQSMLQHYITEFKIEKAQAQLDFVEGRFKEAKEQFEQKQEELAVFQDANRNSASAAARAMEERLSNEYNVALGIYSELAKQREQAGIQVKENTPVFTIVEPVTVPTEYSKPKRGLICVAFTFLGIFSGIALVLGLPYVAQLTGMKRLAGWLPGPKKEKV